MKSVLMDIFKLCKEMIIINIPNKYKEEFDDILFYLNLTRVKFVNLALIFITCILIIIAENRSYRYLYVVLLILMSLWGLVLFISKLKGKNKKIIRLSYEYIVPIILMLWGLAISFEDKNLAAFIIIVCINSMIVIRNPLKTVLVYIITYLLFIFLSPYYFSYNFLMGYYINTTILFLFSIITSRILFLNKLNEFVNKRIVENKKNELVKVNEEISKKSKQLQILFDNIEQGFLLFSDDLIIEEQYSNECIKIFGEDISKKYYPEFIYPDEQEQRQLLEKVLKKALKLDKTNADIYLSLLANELEVNGKQLQVHYKIIKTKFKNKYMIILKDITDKRSLENKMIEEKNTLRMILQAVVYYNDFFECIRDYQGFCKNRIFQIIEEEENQNTALIKIFKCLHTFKGNFYQLHMKNIAEMIHTFEDKLSTLYEKMDSMTKNEIINYFKMVNMLSWLDKEIAILKEILGEKFFRKENILMIDSLSLSELEDNYYSILSESQCQILIPEIRRLRYKPIKEMFEIYKIHLERLATKLYKSVNPLKIIGGDMLVCPEIYSGFIKSLVHIFRNTMDHGIESVEERLKIGKDAFGNIYCDIHTINDKLIIMIADDGSGINLNKLKAKAIEKGIYSKDKIEHLSDDDIIKLIFKEQFSTCNKIGDLSGRGLGLSAVKNEIDKLGGTIEVSSNKNVGTKFKFLLPYRDINYIKETPAKTIMDYFVDKVTISLKDDLDISLKDCQYTKIKLVDIINLNKHTITLKVIEDREYLFVLSADTKMALKILYNVYIGEITEKVDRYIEDALSEMLNVVVGNIIKIIFKNSDQAIMDTPIVISDIKKFDKRCKYKWQYDINSEIGNLKLALLLSENK